MGKDLKRRLIYIGIAIIGSILCTFPFKDRINLGLDLQGGMHLVLQVDTSELDDNAKKDVLPRAIEILRNRIDKLGAAEPIIQQQGEKEILVQLPGVTDRQTAKEIIGTVAKLEFRLVNDNPAALQQALDGRVPSGYLLKYQKDDQEPILVEDRIALDGDTIADAQVDFDNVNFGQPYISLTFNSEGASGFAKLTRSHVGQRLATILDDQVLVAPEIREPILGGKAQITGQFTQNDAAVIALSLRSGALPAPMNIEEERTIGPLLGKDSINSGINATVTGGILVFIFMLIYYLRAGVLTSVALILNLLMLFGIMGFLNITLPASQLTLTLPGIAGIILTLGMAVDANVLINERIREELAAGQVLVSAINSGFQKAFKAILDSQITTFIAAFMLFMFGSGPIKGFAITLMIGLVASLFTAYYVTKTLFLLLAKTSFLNNLKMLRLFQETKIDFVSKRFICFAISVVLVVASFVTWFQRKDSAYGIDFAGGFIQEYRFKNAIDPDDVRAALKTIKMDDVIIQQFKQFPENIIIRTASDSYNEVQAAFKTAFPDNPFDELRVEQVGPVVGKALRRAALLAIIAALGGILLYVGFRFRHFDFATAGVIALLHDVIITLGIILMMGRQIDLLVVTALLTIAGYSINDTIIIYDRVRENTEKHRKKSLAEIINMSVNQTLGRTLLTTITTLLVVISLFLRGGEVLNTFALCLMIGFVAGTYSTMFIASPLVLAWAKKSPAKTQPATA